MYIEALKEESVWAIHKWISNVMLFKTGYITKELKNNAKQY